MGLSLAFSVYILIAFILYYRDRSILKIILRYIQKAVPVSRGVIAFAFLLALLGMPIVYLQSWAEKIYRKLTGVKATETELSEDAARFFEEYYPERLQDLEEVSIELEREDIEEFMAALSPIFDAGLTESQLKAIIDLVDGLEPGDMDRVVFYPRYHEKRMTLVFEVTMTRQREYVLAFSAETELANAIDQQITVYCE